MPATVAARWNRSDLIRRVVNALDVARQMVRAVADAQNAVHESGARQDVARELLRNKVVCETAMLLLCLEPIQSLEQRIQDEVEQLASFLVPYARHQDVLAAICLDPGLARDHAVAHAILSRLGLPDPDVDALVSKSLAMGADFGPERLPHRRLEQAWLSRLWNVIAPPTPRDSRLLADSMLGRPLDALGCSRLDAYALTHAVMYASDLGMRQLPRVRPRSSIAADADAALASSLDSNDFDLTAEVLMIWPMLRLPWSAAATFAFAILANVEDGIGFLPGITFDRARYDASTGDERSQFVLATSYHTAYVMGFLCSMGLRQGCSPPAAVPPAHRSRGSAAALLSLIGAESPTPCWRQPFTALAPRQQDSVASLLLTILLRRARAQGNVRLVREALEVALCHDLIDGPAPLQAAALLRRSEALRL